MRFAIWAPLPLLALSASAATAGDMTVVDVHLSNFKFAPQPIVLNHGQIYALRLINDAGGAHNFTAKTFFAAAELSPADRATLKGGGLEVPARQTREIRLVAPAAGKYDLKCTHFMHPTFGMKGSIVVR